MPGFGRSLTTKTRNFATSHARFQPSLLNEVRFGWMSVSGGQLSNNRGVISPARLDSWDDHDPAMWATADLDGGL